MSSGRSKAGLSVDFTAGGPHQLRHRAAWASLEPGNAVMEIVRNRIRWPFNSHGRHAVTLQRVPNHKSAMATEKPPGCTEQLSPVDWITQAVTELEVTSIVRRVDPDDVVLCCALSMALKSSGKYRLCLDLRPLNRHLRKLRLRMETLRRVRHLFQRGDWLITIDIVSAYHNFLVHPEDQKFCGFFWLGIFYVYAALSFGSSAAPAIFQSLMDAIARYLRRRTVRCGTYIDDWWMAFQCRSEAVAFALEAAALFESLGLIINRTKSVLEPTTRLKVLGFVVDTVAFTFSVPVKRIVAAESLLNELLESGRRREARNVPPASQCQTKGS